MPYVLKTLLEIYISKPNTEQRLSEAATLATCIRSRDGSYGDETCALMFPLKVRAGLVSRTEAGLRKPRPTDRRLSDKRQTSESRSSSRSSVWQFEIKHASWLKASSLQLHVKRVK